ncbi:biotin/lipoyl-binding protein [Paracoccus sp. DMF-8]|uniref:biotin/lipoyl-binding protein n=1 Tax=Paracoccus sp. DMF-8 TaxID=3019445 RepID=UPI0023E3CD70|nr:biotin/lipoyl-binding protein [Paracoccus sp. DMF-8]MDF3607615.1 biotin/lipoyl-binding protein [Paracoccus sp. DMF-8]
MNAPNSSEAPASDIPLPRRDRAAGRSRRGRLIGAAALLIVLACGGAWAMLRNPVSVRHETAPVVRRDLEIAISATGKLQPRAYVDVGAQVSGQLERLHVRVGDLVEPGQLLAEIDAKVQAAQVEGIEADLARLQAAQAEYHAGRVFAERQVTRLSRLAAANAATGVTLEEAERDRDVMAARIEATNAEIRRTEASLRAEKLALEHARIPPPCPASSSPSRRARARRSTPITTRR